MRSDLIVSEAARALDYRSIRRPLWSYASCKINVFFSLSLSLSQCKKEPINDRTYFIARQQKPTRLKDDDTDLQLQTRQQ